METPIGLDEKGNTIYIPIDDESPIIYFTSSSRMGMSIYIHLINNRTITKDANNN